MFIESVGEKKNYERQKGEIKRIKRDRENRGGKKERAKGWLEEKDK